MPKTPFKSTYSRLQIRKKLKDLEYKKDLAEAAKSNAEAAKLTTQLNFFRKLLQVQPKIEEQKKEYKKRVRQKNST
tara:strand:- start:457 stop:684 length:228 start_codon:yes stop_codon:yes gene_type:complete